MDRKLQRLFSLSSTSVYSLSIYLLQGVLYKTSTSDKSLSSKTTIKRIFALQDKACRIFYYFPDDRDRIGSLGIATRNEQKKQGGQTAKTILEYPNTRIQGFQ